jgi:hypothetical protein
MQGMQGMRRMGCGGGNRRGGPCIARVVGMNSGGGCPMYACGWVWHCAICNKCSTWVPVCWARLM